MRNLILIGVVCLQIGWSHGEPKGVGAFAYQDTTGNRYGGTYDLDDHQFNQNVGGFIPHFDQQFQPIDDFFPDYFNNLEHVLKDASSRRVSFRKAREVDPLSTSKHSRSTRSIFTPFPPLKPLPPLPPLIPFEPFPPLKPLDPLPPLIPFQPFPPFKPLDPLPPLKPFEPFPPFKPFKPFPPLKPLEPLPSLFDTADDRTFETNLENQMLAFTAARKAYDLTSNQGGYIPNFPTRYGFPGFPGFGMPNMNSAFASGMAGPGFSHQVAAINPPNPLQGNVNIMNRFADVGSKPGFYSVQTSSFSSSSDIGGKRIDHKKAETIVNNDGKITEYKVES